MSTTPNTTTSTTKTAWWQRLRPALVPHAGWEMLLMRLILAYFIWASVAEVNLGLTSQPKPNGLAEWGLDFTFLAQEGLRNALLVGLALATACWAAGWLVVPALLYMLFVMISAGTLANSQGSIGHSTQLLCMCLLAQFVTLLYLRFRPTGTATPSPLQSWITPPPQAHSQWGIHAMKVTIAAAYFSTGLCKILATNGLWIWQSPLLAVQLMKANVMSYYDKLEPGDPFFTETLPTLIIAHPMLARLAFGSALVLELATIFALLGRRWALGVGLAVIALHLSISQAMRLDFEYHIVLIFALFVNLPYWVSRPFFRRPSTA